MSPRGDAKKRGSSAAKEIRSDCYLMRTLALGRQMNALYARELEGLALTTHQVTMVTAIIEAEGKAGRKAGRIAPAVLAKALHMERSTVSRNLKLLAEAGMVEMSLTPAGRVAAVSASDAGRRALEKALPAWRRAQDQAEELLSAEVLRSLRGH